MSDRAYAEFLFMQGRPGGYQDECVHVPNLRTSPLLPVLNAMARDLLEATRTIQRLEERVSNLEKPF